LGTRRGISSTRACVVVNELETMRESMAMGYRYPRHAAPKEEGVSLPLVNRETTGRRY
jgi:hypothetical protein